MQRNVFLCYEMPIHVLSNFCMYAENPTYLLFYLRSGEEESLYLFF